jgi:hypothetical protein
MTIQNNVVFSHNHLLCQEEHEKSPEKIGREENVQSV